MPFISLQVVQNDTGLWAIGPFSFTTYISDMQGYSLPFGISSSDYITVDTVAGLQGYMFFNSIVDDSNHSEVISYMVGYYPPDPANLTQVAIGIVRFHLNLNSPPSSHHFTFDSQVDVVQLNYNTFTTFHSLYKPFLHFDNSTKNIIVVNPSTTLAHQVRVVANNEPMVRWDSSIIERLGLSITSSCFNNNENLLYVGYSASGFNDGALVAYGMDIVEARYSIDFPGLANPRAIAIDTSTNIVYVGFNGGNVVIQLDQSLTILGYQTLPYYLYQLEAAAFSNGYVYFITNEQYSKVARVSQNDFCLSVCTGYCLQGKCIPN